MGEQPWSNLAGKKVWQKKLHPEVTDFQWQDTNKFLIDIKRAHFTMLTDGREWIYKRKDKL